MSITHRGLSTEDGGRPVPLFSGKASHSWGPSASQISTVGPLPVLSWLFPFSVPSQELQLRPGVWHISGRNAWPLGWPLRRGAGRPAQSLGEPTPGACSSLRRHSRTRLPGSEGPQARGRGFWQPKQLPGKHRCFQPLGTKPEEMLLRCGSNFICTSIPLVVGAEDVH